MNTLATFFASILALFSGLLGHASPSITAQQPISNVVTVSETASSTISQNNTNSPSTSTITVPGTSDTYIKQENAVASTSSNFTNYKNDNYDSNNPTTNTEYTKIGNAIYFNGNRISGVDVETFQLVDLDKFREEGSNDKGTENPQVNYSKDKNKVFYNGKMINSADPSTFNFIYTGAFWQEFGKDRNHIFYKGDIITGADIKTFNAGYARHGYISEGSGPYSFDINNIYYGTSSIMGVDLKTFTAVGCGFMKDKNYFYVKGKIVPGLNEMTFKYPDCDP